MKKGFKNYNYEFDKNEKRVLSAFCTQILKQTAGKNELFRIERAFTSIQEKLKTTEDTVKLTKDEATQLGEQLQLNINFLKKEMVKSWFFKKWIYKSLLTNYTSIYNDYFKN